MRHRGFCTRGIQTGPFAFVPKYFQLPDLYTGKPITFYPRAENEKKGIPKNGEKGFLCFGHSNWTICSFFYLDLQQEKLILFQQISNFLIFILGSPSLITPKLRMRKRESPKNGWGTGVSVLGAFKLDHLQYSTRAQDGPQEMDRIISIACGPSWARALYSLRT